MWRRHWATRAQRSGACRPHPTTYSFRCARVGCDGFQVRRCTCLQADESMKQTASATPSGCDSHPQMHEEVCRELAAAEQEVAEAAALTAPPPAAPSASP